MENKLEEAFNEVFSGQIEYSENLSRESSEVWDSLKHIHLMVTIENSYGVKFEGDEVSKMVSVKAIKEVLSQK